MGYLTNFIVYTLAMVGVIMLAVIVAFTLSFGAKNNEKDAYTYNDFLEQVEAEDYSSILRRYNEYKTQGRIEVTTFHQSYGYEDFIEGIKPIIDENESSQTISYDVKPGVFKNFCEETSKQMGDLETFNSIWEKFIKDVENNNNEVEISLKRNSPKKSLKLQEWPQPQEPLQTLKNPILVLSATF